jgi:hypothetical protein
MEFCAEDAVNPLKPKNIEIIFIYLVRTLKKTISALQRSPS